MSEDQHSETEIFLVDTPWNWSIQDAREAFKKAKCVGGDPLYPCFNVEACIRRGSTIAKDVRAIFSKFNQKPTNKHADMRYHHKGKAVNADEASVGVTALDNAYIRLHTEAYQSKPYSSYRQFDIDIKAVKAKNPIACNRKIKGGRRSGTIGKFLTNFSTRERFVFFMSIVIYRAKSKQWCQFGSTPKRGDHEPDEGL